MDADYLQSTVGDALAEGMAKMTRVRPEDAIDFLGKFLLKFTEKKEREIIKAKRVEISARATERETKAAEADKTARGAAQAESERLASLADELCAKLAETHDVESMLQEVVDVVGECLNSSAYIGFQASSVAPLDPDAEHIENVSVRYLAATSKDSEIVGTHLVEPKGITHGVWAEPEEEEEEEEEEEQGEEDGEEKAEKPPKLVSVRIPNVLRSDGIVFLKGLPRLGSFAAVPVIYDSCLHDDAIGEEIVPEENEDDGDEESKEGEESQAEEGEVVSEGKDEDEGKADEDGEGENGDEAEAEHEAQAKQYAKNTKRSNFVLAVDNISVAKSIKSTGPRKVGYSDSEIEFLHRIAAALAGGMERVEGEKFVEECARRDMHNEESIQIAEAIQSKQEERDEALSGMERPEDALEEQNAYAEKMMQFCWAAEDVSAYGEHIKGISAMDMIPKEAALKTLAAVATVLGSQVSDFTDTKSNKVHWTSLRSVYTKEAFESITTLQVTDGHSNDLAKKLLEGTPAEEAGAALGCASALHKWAATYLEACEAASAKKEAEEKKAAEEAEAAATAAAAAAEAEAEGEEKDGEEDE